MKKIIILAALLSQWAWGAEVPANFNLVCVTSVSAVRVWVEGDKVRFHLEDSNKFANFPLFNGVVTTPMLPLILRAEKELKVFDGLVDAEWPLEKCKVSDKDPLLLKCGSGGVITYPENTGFKLTSLGTWTDQIRSFDVEDEMLNVFFGLDTKPEDYTHYFTNFPFQKSRCQY